MVVVREGSICVDCTLYIANGDIDSLDSAAYKRVVLDPELVWTLACGEDCEGDFSWRPCDRCGCALGGERHPAVVLGPPDPRRLALDL